LANNWGLPRELKTKRSSGLANWPTPCIRIVARIAVTCLSIVVLMGAAAPKQGCGEGLNNRPNEPGIDVGGSAGALWAMSYQDKVEVIVKRGGVVIATQVASAAAGGEIDIDGFKVDLAALCAREDVACPHEVFPAQVRMTQPGSQLHLLYVEFNKTGPLADIADRTLLGNVDSDQDFSIALGIGGAVAGPCGLLSVSYATGNIIGVGTPAVGRSLSGDIVTAYHGACLVSGASGSAAAGLTVELRVPFTGTRL
jgi:hypothetical protein